MRPSGLYSTRKETAVKVDRARSTLFHNCGVLAAANSKCTVNKSTLSLIKFEKPTIIVVPKVCSSHPSCHFVIASLNFALISMCFKNSLRPKGKGLGLDVGAHLNFKE